MANLVHRQDDPSPFDRDGFANGLVFGVCAGVGGHGDLVSHFAADPLAQVVLGVFAVMGGVWRRGIARGAAGLRTYAR